MMMLFITPANIFAGEPHLSPESAEHLRRERERERSGPAETPVSTAFRTVSEK